MTKPQQPPNFSRTLDIGVHLRTVDAGAHWANITPRPLRHLLDHIDNVIAIGPNIWLQMEGDNRLGFLP